MIIGLKWRDSCLDRFIKNIFKININMSGEKYETGFSEHSSADI